MVCFLPRMAQKSVSLSMAALLPLVAQNKLSLSDLNSLLLNRLLNQLCSALIIKSLEIPVNNGMQGE